MQSTGLQERFERRLEDLLVSEDARRLAGDVVEQYVQDCGRRARSASVSASCAASPPPRRSMPSGLLAAGGHDVNWRSLRCALLYTSERPAVQAWPQPGGRILSICS